MKIKKPVGSYNSGNKNAGILALASNPALNDAFQMLAIFLDVPFTLLFDGNIT